MTLKIILEDETVFINYFKDAEEIKEKLDYCAIEKLIDYIMDNNVESISVEDNETCSQYVDLIKTLLQKITEKDFVECYQETKNLNEQPEADSLKPNSDEEIPF